MSTQRFPVITSATPLEFDTLPVLKTRHFHYSGMPQRDIAMVYTYARLYVLRGELQLALCAFEREPAPAASRVAFALHAGGERMALAVLAPKQAAEAMQLWLLPPADCPPLTEPMGRAPDATTAVERFAGVDEQGWYWGARCALPSAVAEAVALRQSPRDSFSGALYKYRLGTSAWGCSCGGRPLDPAAFDSFEVVAGQDD